MTKNAKEFKNIMSSLLLADPITTKGKKALTSLGVHITEEDYIKNLYIEPFTLYERELDETPDPNTDPDYPNNNYVWQVELNMLKNAQNSFEDRLSKLDDSLYVIKGGAGSGKTTYAHHLQQEYRYLKFCFCDFEEASRSILMFGQPYDFGSKFDNNVWKFVSIIICKINRTLFAKKSWSDFSEHRVYIQEIHRNYLNYFSDIESDIPIVDEIAMWEFFKCFEGYVKGEERLSNFKKKLKEHLSDRLDVFERESKHKEVVTYVCGILIRLLFCLNRISFVHGKEKKYICVIDNIESFIPFDEVRPIQECELMTIMNGVADSTTHLRPTIQKWKEKYPNYKTFFGFLLVTRDTSVSLTEYRQYDDFIRENEIDITTWFCIDDVYNRKIDWFKESLGCNLEDNTYYKAYRCILSDVSHYNWGMYDFVCRMYNNNYRRIALDVVNSIANQPEDEMEYFIEKWNSCLKHPEAHATKHMCRKFVFRILLDNIQTTKYFDQLLVEKNDADTRQTSELEINGRSSYARKVATILYRISLMEPGGIPDHFTELPILIKAVLQPPHGAFQPTPDLIEDLSSVLYLMNETRNQLNHWAPLILIKFDIERAYNKDNLKSEMLKQWTLYESNGEEITPEMQKYGVRIRTAGTFFAKMVPDFEYFACRFAPSFPALFVRENLHKVGQTSYRCLEMIKIVRKNAFLCIDEVLNRDFNFFDSVGGASVENGGQFTWLYQENSIYKWLYKAEMGGTLVPHPWRILNHHIGYLQHYIGYVDGLSDELLCDEDKKNIINGVQSEIENYRKKLSKINSERGEYYNK